MAKVQPITLNAYLDRVDMDKAPSLYVINRTSQSEEALGNISFNCLNDLGQPVSVTIPATFIPIDLTTQVPAKNLVHSSFFRRVLEKGQAKIVSTESAETYIAESPRYRDEYNAVSNRNRAADADYKSLRGEDNANEIDLDRSIAKERGTSRLIEGQEVSTNMFVSSFLAHCNDENYTDKELESEFIARGLNLPRNELETLQQYVRRQAIRDLIVDALDDLVE